MALTELARRYFSAYGPATIGDLAAWSGLPMTEVRSGVEGAKAVLVEVTIQGRPAVALRQGLKRDAPAGKGDVRLLPAFDTYLLGYRRRDLAVPLRLQRRLQRGGGWIHPAVVVNGRAVAAWSVRKSGSRGGKVLVEPFERIAGSLQPGIDAEVKDIARFLDLPLVAPPWRFVT
jgi:hypothetical protein